MFAFGFIVKVLKQTSKELDFSIMIPLILLNTKTKNKDQTLQ